MRSRQTRRRKEPEAMPDETRHESADLEDYEVEDASDTLTGDPGDDPLDRGVAAPERWSAGMRFGTTAGEQQSGESLDDLLAEEEPDTPCDEDEESPEDIAGAPDAADEDVAGLLLDEGPDPRAVRRVADDGAAHPRPGAVPASDDAALDGRA